MKAPYLSIVIPIYNESKNLATLFERLIHALDAFGKTYEIIFTNDGSKDDSEKLLDAFYAQHPDKVTVIHFNGNFGQHMAVMAGFARVRGEIAITLDADLQNPPEEIPKLVAAVEAGHDYVGGYRQQRQDNAFRRYASKLNNYIRFKISRIQMSDQGCMLRAYQRRIVDLMVKSDEASPFIPALAYSFASNPTEIPVKHDSRLSGESKYNLYRLLRLNFDLMTGYSMVPLQAFTAVGIVVSLGSTLFFIYLLLRRLMIGPEAQGVFTLFAILFFLIGITLMGLGIVGEYVGRIYQEVRHRPRFVVREVLGDKGPSH